MQSPGPRVRGPTNHEWELGGATPMRIAIYSRSCQNHHRGLTEGCGVRRLNLTGASWGDGRGTPAVPPLMPQERGPPLAPPLPTPLSRFSLGRWGGGCGKRV